MPFISKLPNQPRSFLSSAPRRRPFLTKPSSWAKLTAIALMVALTLWFNFKEKNKKVQSTSASKGVVAGVSSSAVAERPPLQEKQSAKQLKGEQPKDSKGVSPAAEGASSPPQLFLPDPDLAESPLAKAIKDSGDFKNLFLAGSRYLDEGRLSLAELSFKRCLELNQNYREVWYLLGATYLKEFAQNPVAEERSASISKLDWALVALNRARLIDPFSSKVSALIKQAEKLKQNRADR